MNRKTLLLIIAILCPFVILAQEQHPENCPFGGQKDCTGQCGLFTDDNNDGYCDYAVLSSQKQTAKEENKPQNNTNNTVNKQDNTSKRNNQPQKIDNNQTISKIEITSDSSETLSGATQTMTETVTEQVQQTNEAKPQRKFPYHLWQVLLATLILYGATALLVKMKKIKKVNHRRLWNVILAVTFLVSCFIGLYVAFAKLYGWSMDYLTLMQLHVDFGISMTVVAMIHCLWHLKYWKNILKNGNNKA